MSIKNLKPSHKSNYKQGYYNLINESKYVGPKPIIFRSGWERSFAIYCDKNKNILKWSSEPFAIKYFSLLDKKYHTYYPDFYIKIQKGSTIKEYVVEVKPSSQLKKPTKPKRKTKKAVLNYNKAIETYIINLSKFDAMKKFANLIITRFCLLLKNRL